MILLNPDCLNSLIIKDSVSSELPHGNYIINCLLTNTILNNKLTKAAEVIPDPIVVGCINKYVESLGIPTIPFTELTGISTKLNYMMYDESIVVRTNTGCKGKCTYCNIHGQRADSYSLERILEAIDSKMDSNIKSIILTSNDSSIYSYKGMDIFDIVRIIKDRYGVNVVIQYLSVNFVISNLDKMLALISLGYIYHLGISIQSGSDRILESMNRNYKYSDIVELIYEINKVKPEKFYMYTEFLYGYYGETESDIYESLKLASLFDYVVWYRYYQLNGSAASMLYPDYHIGTDYSRNIMDFAKLIGKRAAIVDIPSFVEKYNQTRTNHPEWLVKL